MRDTSARYDSVAIALHWLIAALILINLTLGAWMAEAIAAESDRALAIAVFQLHKSLGLTVLALSLVRLLWRLTHRAPPLPSDLPVWQRRSATISHTLLYALMVLLPLSGWLTVSTQWRGDGPLQVPTLWFGLFEVPHLFGLANSPVELRHMVANLSNLVHRSLGWALSLLLIAHIGAALHHHYRLRDAVLQRMLPTRPGGAFFIVALVLALALGGWLLPSPPVAEEPDAQNAVLEKNWPPPTATAWQPLVDESQLQFSGEHAGEPFSGLFSAWSAALYFDPDRLAASQLHARILTASASDGVPLHDRTLRESEWFAVDEHPLAHYRSLEITTAAAGGAYAVRGELSIKGRTVPVPELTLKTEGDTMRLEGTFKIDRAEVDMGMESDPDGEYVSRQITVRVQLMATRR